MTVERRINLTTALIGLFAVIVGLILVMHQSGVQSGLDQLGVSSAVVRSAFQMRALMDEYLASGDARPLTQWLKVNEFLGKAIADAQRFDTIDPSLLKELADRYRNVNDLHHQISQLGISENQDEHSKLLKPTLAGMMAVRLEELVDAAQHMHRSSQSTTLRRQNLAQLLILAAFLAMIGLIVMNLYLMKRSIIVPLQELAAAAEGAGTDDFRQLKRTDRKGETGRLTQTFNAMVARLQAIHDSLRAEMARRQQVQEELRRLNEELEIRVRDRTAELTSARMKLEQELHERKKAEEALQQSEERLRLAQSSANIGIWERNLQSGQLVWTKEMESIYGYEEGTFPGTYDGFSERVHPEDLAEFERMRDEAVNQSKPFDFDFRIRLHSGETRWVHCKGAAHYDGTGNPDRVFGVNVDITDRKKAEEELHIAFQRFYSILSNQYAGLLLVAEEGRIEFANQAFCDQFELKVPPSLLQGLTPQDIIQQIQHVYAEPAQAVNRIREILDEMQPVKDEEISIRGGKTYLRDFIPIKIEGKPYGRLWHHRDITDRKKAEDALREARDDLELRVQERTAELEKAKDATAAERQRLYDVLETLPVYVCLLDSDYHMPFANRYFRETFGESLGRRCHEFLFNRTEPCEICETYTVMKTRSPHHWYWTGPNGRHYDIYDFPFIDDDGSMLILEMGIDITERKQAEAALKQTLIDLTRSNEDLWKWGQVFEHARWGIVVSSEDGLSLAFMNPEFAKMHGYTVEELTGRPIPDVYAPEERTGLIEQIAIANQKGHHIWESKHIRKDGTIFPVLIDATAVKDEDGNVLYRVVNVQNITERKHSEDVLKRTLADLTRSNQELQQFAYVASHDLQEPLRNVASCLQLLEKKYKHNLDADADQYIRYAVESSVRMKALILDLLAYSRVATRGKPPGRTDCEQALDQTLNNLTVAISEAGAKITHDPLPTIRADYNQLLLVFQNLIQNAIKFRRDEPSRAHVSAVKNKDEWVFSVKDNGIGIESQYLDRIFVIFQRLHRRSEYDGTGMGLAIVKKVIERHGGRIWAESQPGVGTTVCFTIPEKGIGT